MRDSGPSRYVHLELLLPFLDHSGVPRTSEFPAYRMYIPLSWVLSKGDGTASEGPLDLEVAINGGGWTWGGRVCGAMTGSLSV